MSGRVLRGPVIGRAAGVAAQEAERVIGCWRPGERRDLHREISRVTLGAPRDEGAQPGHVPHRGRSAGYRQPPRAGHGPEEAQRLADEGTALPPESLPCTSAVIREAPRLCPPGWITGREAACGVGFQGCAIPAGTSPAVSQRVTRRGPRFHGRPAEFIPDRWPDGSPGSAPRGACFPLGLGPRACPGASVAMTEAAVIVAALWRRFRLELPEGAQVRPRPCRPSPRQASTPTAWRTKQAWPPRSCRRSCGRPTAEDLG